MSNNQREFQDPQQWIVVTKNKNKHKGSLKNKQIHNRGNQNLFSSQFKEEYIEKFLTSKIFFYNQKLVSETIEKVQKNSELSAFHIQCLGLGNFLSNKKAFIQLQFLENILLPICKKTLTKKHQNEIMQKSERQLMKSDQMSINVFDPAFSKAQGRYLQSKQYSSVQKFQIKTGKVNIFFMPHCERNLYEAVYEKYQNKEQKNSTPLVVIGNSIQEYIERCSLVKEKVPDILLQIKVSEERIFDYENALNDTFILI